MKMATLWVCLTGALLSAGASAASLRAAPVAAKPEAKEAEVPAVVSDLVGSLLAAHDKKEEPPKAAASGPVTHQKLDVGFADFEKNLTAAITKKLSASATGSFWTDNLRAQLNKNVTEALKSSLKVTLQPVKQSIGKTWMALPKDEQKDEYVTTLKSSFVSVFDNSMKAFTSHLDLGLKRLEALSLDKSMKNSTKLLQKAEFTVEDNLLTEHCYEVDAKKPLKSVKNAGNSSSPAEKKKFCIQSVVGALAHRLNDTQGLISMSMRFESGAMSLAQQQKKKPLLH